MTTVLEPDVASVSRAGRKRRIWPLVLIGVVGLSLVGLGIGRHISAEHYMPLVPGNGPYDSVTPSTLKTVTDGIDDSHLILVGPTGVKGTLDLPVANNGRHAVTILGIDRAIAGQDGGALAWSPVSTPSGRPIGEPSEARPFPVTIRPGDEVILQLTVSKPVCPTGGTESLLSLPVRWSALGVTHVWNVAMGGHNDPDNAPILPVALCFPKAALAHVDRSF